MQQNTSQVFERHHYSLATVKSTKPFVQTKIIQSSNFSKNIKDLRASTNIKFYQKTNKRTSSNYFKQKNDTIKPIVCFEFQDNQFCMQPQKFQKTTTKQDNSHLACIGLINPMYINVKNNGAKRLTMSKQLNKQKQQQKSVKKWSHSQSIEFSSSNPSPQKKTNVYNKIVSQMNDYFTLMKLSAFKNNKLHLLSKRAAKSKIQRRTSSITNNSRMKTKEQETIQADQLNVIGLKPLNQNSLLIYNSSKGETPIKYERYQSALNQQKQLKKQNFNYIHSLHNLEPKLVPSVTNNNQEIQSTSIQKNNSRFLQTKSITIYDANINSSCLYKSRQIRPFTQQIPRNPLIKKSNGVNDFCFGIIDPNKLSLQQIHRLKIMYFKDLIWKNSFSLGFKYQNSQKEQLKFYVGKGNNSKLIKKMMAKRWWWSIQNKQENANFLWTQLKVYSIYQKQESLNKLSSRQQIQQAQTSKILQQVSQIQDENQEIPKWHDQYVKIYDKSSKILTKQKYQIWKKYLMDLNNISKQKKCSEQNLSIIRKRLFNSKNIKSSKKITNHLEQSRTIGNKKALYKVMMLYFKIIKKVQNDQIFIPLTYHITAGLQDDEYLKFLSEYYRRSKSDNKTCWIVKPGELTNRGNGIRYCRNLNQIKPIIKKKQNHNNGTLKTFLIQQYIDRPLLYKQRKFDIRHYIMLSSTQGVFRGYFYQEGYIRTTSYKYKLQDNSSCIHLTNDAVQKYCKDYGKYQKGNKLSYEELAQYLQGKAENTSPQKKEEEKNTTKNNSSNSNIFKDFIFPQIRQIAIDVIYASSYFVDPNKRKNNFQIFGLDLMIDENFKCFLIQVNTNPCLQLSSPLLSRLIPEMVDNALALTIDCQYPPPDNISNYQKKYTYPTSFENKFQLVFDSRTDGQIIKTLYQTEGVKPVIQGVGDDDQNYQSCEEDNYQG